jgi:F-type H+-transporting ATPase subunit gamma
MASLKDIRKRVASVKNTRQITRAMKMVDAAKLRRAQEAILQARPYAYRVYAMVLSLVSRGETKHPLLAVRPEKRVKVVVLAGERGLCGGFNTNILREATKFMAKCDAEGKEVVVDVIGRKALEFLKKRRTIASVHEDVLGRPSYMQVAGIANRILKDYVSGEFDAVYLVYNEFKSAIQQRPTVERMIPVSTVVPDGVAGVLRRSHDETPREAKYEPSREAILDALLPRHFQAQLFRAVLESKASEHGARMSAMDNATKNATEMIERLTLEYNKARQAAITKELMEIVGGVEAMR